ncbi:MAG: polysaccharide pyruvyl transferase family protein [Cyanobium sp.]
MDPSMRLSKASIFHYFFSRLSNRSRAKWGRRGAQRSGGTVILTEGFNGNLGDQALLQVAASACRSRRRPHALLTYANNPRQAPADTSVIMAGGEIGTEEHFRTLMRTQPNPQRASILGIAFNNVFLQNPSPEVQHYLSGMDAIWIRDKGNATHSREQLSLPNIHYSPDITFSLAPEISARLPEANDHSPHRRTVGINVQTFFCNILPSGRFTTSDQLAASLSLSSPGFDLRTAVDGYMATLRNLIAHHHGTGDYVVLFSFSPVDTAFSKLVLAETNVQARIVETPWNFPAMIERIRRCDLFYPSRFHAHIAALMARTPLIGLEVGKKNAGLLADLSGGTCQSLLPREAFMVPEQATESLLTCEPFQLSSDALAAAAQAASHSIASCFD